MADLDDIKDGKDFRTDQPQKNIPFTLKGCGALDWGMQSRLSRIFNPKTGKTVMLAFDHGYFQGPTTGLERIDRGARRIRKKSYAKVFRASVRAETSRLPVCGSAARRNRRLG